MFISSALSQTVELDSTYLRDKYAERIKINSKQKEYGSFGDCLIDCYDICEHDTGNDVSGLNFCLDVSSCVTCVDKCFSDSNLDEVTKQKIVETTTNYCFIGIL